MILRANLLVPKSCCVNVSVFDVSATMDLLQGGVLTPRRTPSLEEQVLYSSVPSPGTFPTRLDLPGTEVPAGPASRVIKVRKPPYHSMEQQAGKSVQLNN